MVNNNKIVNRIGMIGIVVNAFLCTFKLIVGYLSNSISIISDGYNNLSDVGNALFIYLGYRIANKPADKNHPYGHGRFEYIISQGISLMITIVGINLLTTSINRLINPEVLTYNIYALLVLIVSIVIKVALAIFYDHLYKQTKMETLNAQKTDSLSDVAGTIVIVVAYLIMPHTKIPLDSIIGILLSAMIIYSGVSIFIRMTSILIGQPLEEDLYGQIEEIIKSFDYVKSYHNIYLHSYGLKNNYGSCEVEIDGNLSFVDAHMKIETIEEAVKEQTGINFTIHANPIDVSDKNAEYSKKLNDILLGIDERIVFYNFHYNSEMKAYIVNIVLPYDCKYKEDYIEKEIINSLNNINLIIKTDYE